MTRMGFQMPNFSFPGVRDDELFERLALLASTAEDSGFDTVFVMDHFYQLPGLGAPDLPMLEGYTLLSALAARTERARLGTLVTGVTYRNPAHLAKIVTTLDLVSKGRALLGIGAAWFEVEHRGLGFVFPPIRERMDRLEEALTILTAMLRGERLTFDGRHYRTRDVINSPAPLQRGRLPILIGGSGEKRTLRIAAKFGDESNLTCAPCEIPRKLEALARHCRELGRDRSDLRVSWLGSLVVGRSHEEAAAKRDEFFAARGMQWSSMPDHVQENIAQRFWVGDADSIGERVQKELLDVGLDGLVVNLPADGHLPESVILAGETLAKALG
jgi:F420-dependent oxidoreductase-like protein